MNSIQRFLRAIDRFQRHHSVVGFPYAVIKKYGNDEAGYQAALVTYYGFLSLFPLLLVVTTVAGFVGRHDPVFGRRLVTSVSSYFPVVGKQLDSSVHGLNKGGPALVVGILFTIYGARGVADAFRHAVNHIWHIPQADRSGFPKALLRSLAIIVGGGSGFLAASIIAGWAASAGHGVIFRLLSIVLNLVILSLVFIMLLKMSLPLHINWRKLSIGATVAAVGLTILQIVGGYVVTHEARSLSNSYSALFATTLGLLAWIYLQVQILLYAVEIDTVRDRKLWPRSLTGKDLTAADRQVYRGQAKKEQVLDQERIQADFK
jgi:YihY family inner membrane protein